MKMRKFLALALALIMIFSLVACKPAVDTDDSSADDTDPIVNPPETDVPENTGDETEDTSETSGTGDETEEPQGPEFTEVNETVYVYGTDVLNVRKEASADSEKMGEMKEGEQVTRIGYNAKWSKISYYGETYYASSDYLTTHAPLEFDDKTDTVYIVAEGSLNLRKKPAASADVVAYLPYGTALDRTGIATTEDEFGTTWSRLLYNGEVCYASTSYLSEKAPAVTPTDDFNAVNEDVYIVAELNDRVIESLNLRATPSLSGNIVVSVPAGTKLLRVGVAKEADEEGIVWSKVIYNNVTCYASSGYLTTDAPETAEDTTDTTNAAD